MSLVFGTNVPKFVGTGDPDSATVTLYYSILEPSWSEKSQKMFESPVSSTGHRTWKYKGRHASFKVFVHIMKHQLFGGSVAKTWVSNLLRYDGKDVIFYPFKDAAVAGDGNGLPLKNSSDATITCRIANIEFDFLQKAGSLYDVCTITFITNDFYDITKSVLT